jgi:hypothetical protein
LQCAGTLWKRIPGSCKKIRESIEKDNKEFLTIFQVNAGNFTSFTGKLKKGDSRDYVGEVAKEITNKFAGEKDLKVAVEVIVRESIRNYQAAFFKTMSEKQADQLVILILGVNFKIIQESLAKLVTEVSTKEDINRVIAEIKELFEKKKEEAEKKPKGKQIKILSIMASPEAEKQDYYIEYEKEQDTMLDAFKQFDRERVFLDMPDPVRSTLEEIQEYLDDGHHDVLYISAHGGKNQDGQGVLFLEDARGKVKQVTGAELANVLNPCPKMVILSACHSASPEPELIPAAQALLDAAEQVKAVIGMEKP